MLLDDIDQNRFRVESILRRLDEAEDEEDIFNTLEQVRREELISQEQFEKLMEEKMSPNEYIGIAKVSSSQINSLIIELTDSGATQEWVESYVNYISALKKLNEKITETIVVANLMNDDDNSNSINEIIAKMHQLETESLDLIKKSDNTRP